MKVENIDKATTQKGSLYHKLTIDGKIYNYFDDLGNIKVGDDVLCEFETKGKFTNLKSIEKVTMEKPGQTTLAQHDVIIQRTDKPHSYEFGKANNRHKIYYNKVEELKAHIDMLETAGLLDQEVEIAQI